MGLVQIPEMEWKGEETKIITDHIRGIQGPGVGGGGVTLEKKLYPYITYCWRLEWTGANTSEKDGRAEYRCTRWERESKTCLRMPHTIL